MKEKFIKTLIKLAEKDENIYLLTGDLGFPFFEDFAKRFPKRFINCGVAEQNMVGVAAGLGLSGKKPYIYSIVPFLIMRCLEQIRNDICYQNLDVKLIGVGGGFSYGELGATHQAIEDIGILRSLPNITILCPADLIETEELILKSYQTKSPTYIRLVRKGEEGLYNLKPQIEIGKPSIITEGKEGVIIGTGPQVIFCLKAVEKLKKIGHDFKLINLHTLKPIKKEALLKEIKEAKNIFTVEEHNIIGGLGSAVAEILVENGWQGNFKRIGVPDEYSLEVGGTEYFCKKYKLDSEGIVEIILKQIK